MSLKRVITSIIDDEVNFLIMIRSFWKENMAKEFMRKVMEVIILVETRINEKNEYE